VADIVYRLSETIEYVAVTPDVASGSVACIDATVFIQSDQFHLHQLAQDTLAQRFTTLDLAVVVLPAIPLTEQGKPDRLALAKSHPRDVVN
jgi:hypothetical protein